jgi:hypothetical protein
LGRTRFLPPNPFLLSVEIAKFRFHGNCDIFIETKLDLKRANCDLDEFTTRQETQVNFLFQSVHVTEHIIRQVLINALTGQLPVG